jgi:hypothetical protein
MGGSDGFRARGSAVLDRLDPELARKLEESYRGFAAAAGSRALFDGSDPAVRRCEGWFTPEASDGKTLKAAVQAVKEAVNASREPCLHIRETEAAALAAFREALTRLSAGGARTEPALAPGVLPDLEEWARLRGLELEWIDGLIQHSNQILQQPATSPWERFRALLGLRRGCCERASSVRRDYQALERRTKGDPASPPSAADPSPPPRRSEEAVVEILEPEPSKDDPAGGQPDETGAELTVLARVVADRLDEVRRKLGTRLQRLEADHRAELKREREARTRLEARLAALEADRERLRVEAERTAAAVKAEADRGRAALAAREADLAASRERLSSAEQALEQIRAAYRAIDGALSSMPRPAGPEKK